MAELAISRLWVMRIAYLGLATLIVFFHLLPLDTLPRRWAPPDLLVAFTFAWVLRRPDYVPITAIAAVMLMADLMLQRPPGLMAMLVVLGSEYLRGRAMSASEPSFAGEWAAVAATILAVLIANRLILWLLAVQQAPLGLTLMQAILTAVTYPLVALATHHLMGVRRLPPGDQESVGARA